MKVNERETEYGGGEDHIMHTLILHDMHREYTGDFGSRLPDNYGQTEIAWSSSAVIDTLSELKGYSADQAETEARRLITEFLPMAFIAREGDYIEAVWRLTGSTEYLATKFDQLCQALQVDAVSGDDDAFDYWPNTMDMLWDFALDLDDITGASEAKLRVWRIAKAVFQGTVKQPMSRDDLGSEALGELVAEQYKLFVDEWGLEYQDRANSSWRDWFLRADMRGG